MRDQPHVALATELRRQRAGGRVGRRGSFCFDARQQQWGADRLKLGGGTVVQLVGFVKKIVTGRTPDLGENRMMRL